MTMTEAPGALEPEAAPGPPDNDPPVTSLRERLVPPMPNDRLWGWAGPLLVTALAAVLRLWDLGKPKSVMFDETYYAKDGWSLIHFGYERNWVDGANDKIIGGDSTTSSAAGLIKSSPEYVVHPPVGKWVIGLGEHFFGLTPFGWRIAIALLSTVSVLVLCRLARRMFRSTLLGCIAGLILAVDGLALVMSRTALLDGVLTCFLVFAFACLVADRDWGRTRIADAVEAGFHTPDGDATPGIGGRIEGRGPRLWWRPWRVAAGVFMGLALGTKWNGLFFLVAFVVMVAFWDFGARKAIGVRDFRRASLRLDLWPLLLALIVLPVAVYMVSWAGWIIHWGPESGYYRNWASTQGPTTLPYLGIHVPLVPDWFRSLWHYHHEAYEFNKNLSSPHPYQSNPWGWLVLARPVAVYYVSIKDGANCPSGNCSSAITALGNPLVWWVGILALLHSSWRWVAHRDWRGGAIVAGIIGGYFPWFMYQHRTAFSFYAVVLVPFIALAIAQAAGALLGSRAGIAPQAAATPSSRTGGAAVAVSGSATATATGSGSGWVSVGERLATHRETIGSVVVAAYLAATVLLTAYFWPVWTGQVIPYADWLRRMWFKSWI